MHPIRKSPKSEKIPSPRIASRVGDEDWDAGLGQVAPLEGHLEVDPPGGLQVDVGLCVHLPALAFRIFPPHLGQSFKTLRFPVDRDRCQDVTKVLPRVCLLMKDALLTFGLAGSIDFLKWHCQRDIPAQKIHLYPGPGHPPNRWRNHWTPGQYDNQRGSRNLGSR